MCSYIDIPYVLHVYISCMYTCSINHFNPTVSRCWWQWPKRKKKKEIDTQWCVVIPLSFVTWYWFCIFRIIFVFFFFQCSDMAQPDSHFACVTTVREHTEWHWQCTLNEMPVVAMVLTNDMMQKRRRRRRGDMYRKRGTWILGAG